MPSPRLSEQRARAVTRDLLAFRGWDIRPVSSGGQLLEETEHRYFKPLAKLFEKKSKLGPGDGKPDFLLVDSPDSLRPQIVIDTKPRVADLAKSIADTHHYAEACRDAGHDVLSAAIAGAESEVYAARVQRLVGNRWADLTLHQEAIDWIPSPQQTKSLLADTKRTEVSPERPPDHVLAAQAKRLNEIFRECDISDAIRPIYAATFMLALWYSDVSVDPEIVLQQVNGSAKRALQKAGKVNLSYSLRVNDENRALAQKAWQIVDILKKLNIRSFMQEHDYLGQLYETFFKYTGGNTIGQYFTPRHIVELMCDLTEITPSDVVFDPACGTGGFLVGALNRMIRQEKISYAEAINKVKNNLFGIESEPTTAALCVTNMILRGDGTSGIISDDCFTNTAYPPKPVNVAILNPPFPHDKKVDAGTTKFIDRALASVQKRGTVAAIIPYAVLANAKDWHRELLSKHRVLFIATLPPDLFQPSANYDTAILMIQKGVPHNNQRVFFCRIDNDGYKLKKAARIQGRAGSQLPLVHDAYSAKTEIPEFSAYKPLTASAEEWVPEQYIASGDYKFPEFTNAFEEHVRAQSAFYIHHGHRLVHGKSGVESAPAIFGSDSDIDLAGVEWGAFRVDQYFSIQMGGKDEIEDLDDGPIPLVSTSAFDNGVTAWKEANVVFPPNAITVATDGSAYSSFVQEYPFYAFYKVAILRPLKDKNIPVDALYFVAYLLNREIWRFRRARKFGKARISSTELVAPVKNGEPDFSLMAKVSRKTASFPIIASFRAAFKKATESRFARLAKEWKAAKTAAAKVSKLAKHPAYQEIISMGQLAVPMLLRELEAKPDHWFVALNSITGVDPVPEDDQGKLQDMARAWIKWGKSEGFSW